jgi:signal transduction histidine kinase
METATRYNEDYEMKMYFIIMELSNNIIKHSNAVNAFISIEEKNKSLFIHVQDNGKGFDSNEYNTIEGFGLNQIKARINNMGGEITVLSKIKSGTSIQIVPFHKANYARFSISIISVFILSPSITKRNIVRT